MSWGQGRGPQEGRASPDHYKSWRRLPGDGFTVEGKLQMTRAWSMKSKRLVGVKRIHRLHLRS